MLLGCKHFGLETGEVSDGPRYTEWERCGKLSIEKQATMTPIVARPALRRSAEFLVNDVAQYFAASCSTFNDLHLRQAV